ncbi:MAG: signal peptidase I [Candidatus Electrothrix sp. AU1_5]|nr:signal peptidase I [Candidatus Electrothrix gigas]
MAIDPEKSIAFLAHCLLHQESAWLRVTSGSMAPMIPTGSQILITSFDDTRAIRFGDIVVFRDAHSNLIVHRVLFIQAAQKRFLQCGDNAQSPGFVSLDTLCGVVQKVTAYDKEFDFDSCPAKLLNMVMGMTSLWILGLGKCWPKAGWLFRRLRCKIVVTMMRYV